MSDLRSTFSVIPASSLADCNKLYNAIGHDGSANFAMQLSANGQEPATHYAAHSWETPERAILKQSMAGEGAVLPEIQGVWADFGLTEQSALSAAQAFDVSVRVPGIDASEGAAPNVLATQHVEGMLTALGLQRVVQEM